MPAVNRFVLVTSLLLAPASSLLAQPAGDPSGHWTGAIHVPAFNGASPREVAIDIDLAKNAKGELAGTFAGLTAMAGEFVTAEGGYTIPFDLKRTGDALIAAAPRNAAIGKELEGTWNGTVEYQGRKERLVLKCANQPDGTATGTIVDLDGSNMEIPIAMTQKGANVTFEIATVSAAYTAVLAGNELAGTWTQGGLELRLTMTRAAK